MSGTLVDVDVALVEGLEALAGSDWAGARDAFQGALSVTDSPEALDGLARALWWLREERDAVVHRERVGLGSRAEAAGYAVRHLGDEIGGSPLPR